MRSISSTAFVLVCTSLALLAQPPWTNIVDPSRAMDWSGAGVTGGIPTNRTQCGSTIAAYGSSASPASPATINNAIASCAANHYVQLAAGTFYLNAGITFQNSDQSASYSNVTLRGMGADQTFLVFSGNDPCNGLNGLVCMAGANDPIDGVNNVCNWTGGLSSGSTTITISGQDCASGGLASLNIGSALVLDQVDATQDTGTIFNCHAANCAAEGSWYRTDSTCVSGTCERAQQQIVTVTNCTNTAGNCTSGTNLTITPAINLPNWASGQKPEAYFSNFYLIGAGLENLTIDNSCTLVSCSGGSTGTTYNITMYSAIGSWVKGVRSLYANRAHVEITVASNNEIRDNYFYQQTSHESESYCMENENSGNNKIENNIFQQCTDMTPGGAGGFNGNVILYNFAAMDAYDASPGWFQQSYYIHDGGDFMNLWEGNIGPGFTGDAVHGNHHFETAYRNYFTGWQTNCGGAACASNSMAVGLQAGSRYWNLVANVSGTAGYHTIYNCVALTSGTCNSSNAVYSLGFTGVGAPNTSLTGFCTTPSCGTRSDYDPLTSEYLLRWGNWDDVTNAVRWCGGSSDTGWSTTCSSTSEVPSTLASFANAIPTLGDTGAGQGALPVSFVYSSKPSWWGNHQWPPIGPDVSGTAGTGGILGVCSGGTYGMTAASASAQCSGGSLAAGLGSHVALTPAMDCAINTMGMPVDGSGSALSFNASACYAGTSGGSTISGNAPMSGTVIIH